MRHVITIKDLLADKGKSLKISAASGQRHLNRAITSNDINRPGLALAGHLDNFRAERIQIIGRGEHAFCVRTDKKELTANVSKMLSGGKTPCLIITAGMKSIPALERSCERAGVPLLKTAMDTASFIAELIAYLEDKTAPSIRVHGVLVDVYGLGVLIRGGAGVGKSECALELVKRGHILVADDIVEIERRRGDYLMGRCPSVLRHYMEVRGLGIIDIELLFGVGSVMEKTKIEMEVELMTVSGAGTCDRTGLEQKISTILGVDVPSVCIPVTPGRNLAVLIEVASLNQRLKAQGIFAAQEFNKKLIKTMSFQNGKDERERQE